MRKMMIAGLMIILQACSSSVSVKELFDASTPDGVSTAVAHRGCWLREPDGEYFIPENSTYGIEMAARFGYPAVEMDVKYTKDRVMVCMHDGTINRTMRNASDYSKLEAPVRVSETLFEDLRKGYVLESSDPSKRTPIPTLEEMLKACRKSGIVPMLHSKVLESYELAQKILGDGWIAFDGDYQALCHARRVSNCLVLWDPGRASAKETIGGLRGLGGWVGMSTMKYDMEDAAYIDALHNVGYWAQASIFPTPHEQRALRDDVDIELSDFFWHQTNGRTPESTVNETVTLKSGESWKSPEIEVGHFAAMTVHLSYTGNLQLRVKDHIHRDGRPADWKVEDRVYPLSSETPAEALVGLRLYKSSPEFEIVAEEDVNVTIKADVYDI